MRIAARASSPRRRSTSPDSRRQPDSEIVVDAPLGRGFVVARPGDLDPRRWLPALERAPPIFVRSLFVGTGPHPLLDPRTARGRPDRIAPLAALIERFSAEIPLAALLTSARRPAGFASLRLETPDTNDGKELSGLARALAARLTDVLRDAGVMVEANGTDAAIASANLHVLFTDGAHAYVGASVAPWASRWPMGIPRLRMPGGAPSRSTLKLAEALVTFLGEREPDLLRRRHARRRPRCGARRLDVAARASRRARHRGRQRRR